MVALTSGIKQTYTLSDHKANRAHVSMYFDTAYTAAAASAHASVVGQDIYALQTGDSVFESDGATATIVGRGAHTTNAQPWTGTFNSSGAYHSAEDKAVFVFMSASGQRHSYQIPQPLTTIFLADQETIDNSQTVVKQFVADMLAATYSATTPNAAATKAVVDAGGVALKSFVGGFRIRRKMQRKLTIFTKNPAETGPGE